MSKEFAQKAAQAEAARKAANATPIPASDGGAAAEPPGGEGPPEPTRGDVHDFTAVMPTLGTPAGAPSDLEDQCKAAEEMLEIFGGFPRGDEVQLDDENWEEFYEGAIYQPGDDETIQTNTTPESGENMNPIDNGIIGGGQPSNEALASALPDKPINKMLVADLRSELKKRGLATSGLKPELKARLVAAIDGLATSEHPPHIAASPINLGAARESHPQSGSSSQPGGTTNTTCP